MPTHTNHSFGSNDIALLLQEPNYATAVHKWLLAAAKCHTTKTFTANEVM